MGKVDEFCSVLLYKCQVGPGRIFYEIAVFLVSEAEYLCTLRDRKRAMINLPPW